jgi:uncharacterized surface protein with fasciclin (FAS1) repeats
MNLVKNVFVGLLFMLFVVACGENKDAPKADNNSGIPETGQANAEDNVSEKNIVKVAVGSPDHTTLVAAVKAASLVDVLASSGPYTVFAPNNAAFAKLPAGTVETLLKPENKGKLSDILQHHVTTSSYSDAMLKDGMKIGMADGKSVIITRKGDEIMVGKAKVLGAAKASNGMVYIVDSVILPE